MLPTDHIANLGDALRDAVASHRSRVATIEADRTTETRRLTYDAFGDEAAAYAARLAAIGVGAGDRVAIALSNQSAWLTTATAAFWLGAVLVPVDYKLSAHEQDGVLRHARPAVLVTEWATWRSLSKVWDPAAHGAAVRVLHAPPRALDDALRWELDDAAPAALPAPCGRTRDDVACIVYSSGTGGDVKGCMLTHGNYLAQAQALGVLFPMQPGERFFSILPTNHAIDFMTGFLMPLMFGATVVHQRSLRPEFLRFSMKRYRPTHMAAVPRLLRAFKERVEERLDGLESGPRLLTDALIRLNEAATLKTAKHGLSRRLLGPLHAGFGGRLRYVFAGGAFVDPELANFFYRLGLPIVIGYGLTEAGTVLTVNDLKPFRPDTVGRPVAGVSIEVRGAGDDGVGEVWASGPTIMAGYFDNEALTEETIVDGWLRTGDLGWIDPAGHLRLVGRARNMIVTEGGKNVYPEDVETQLEGIDGVEEMCVFSADYVWPRASLSGEALFVAVRLSESPGEWRAALAAANARLAEHKRLAGVLVVDDEFPRTASMKIKRRALAEWLAQRATRDQLSPLQSEHAA